MSPDSSDFCLSSSVEVSDLIQKASSKTCATSHFGTFGRTHDVCLLSSVFRLPQNELFQDMSSDDCNVHSDHSVDRTDMFETVFFEFMIHDKLCFDALWGRRVVCPSGHSSSIILGFSKYMIGLSLYFCSPLNGRLRPSQEGPCQNQLRHILVLSGECLIGENFRLPASAKRISFLALVCGNASVLIN